MIYRWLNYQAYRQKRQVQDSTGISRRRSMQSLYSLYRQTRVQERLNNVGIFRYLEMQYTPRDTTFVCDTLDVNIHAALDKPYDAELDFNVKMKSNNQTGPGASFTVTKNNVFGGGEAWNVKLDGSYEWQTGKDRSSLMNSYEVGLSTSLMFPRVVFPRFGDKEYDFPATTTFKLYIDQLNRAKYYKLLAFGGNATYDFQPKRTSKHTGMGSRYGGLKQLDGLGPNGETIMDYSIYDAINAGFGKLVFVIRKDFEQDFREKIISKYEGHIPCELVFQALDNLPEGFTCPAERTKPWGTNHAVMMGADVIQEPFAVINCDDFYGRDSFQVMGKFLSALPEGAKNTYAMVGFRVGNTLSESGTVSRGICGTNADHLLTSVVERTKIQRIDGEVKYIDDNGEWTACCCAVPTYCCSMNLRTTST